MRFHSRFWEKRAPEVAFFHVPQAPFPDLLDPAADARAAPYGLGRRPESGAPHRIVEGRAAGRGASNRWNGFRTGKGTSRRSWRRRWSRTGRPTLCRGGYSYVRVGGEGAREWLAEPIEDTLFFAGEATDVEEAGTVAGALRSGERAAREVLKKGV